MHMEHSPLWNTHFLQGGCLCQRYTACTQTHSPRLPAASAAQIPLPPRCVRRTHTHHTPSRLSIGSAEKHKRQKRHLWYWTCWAFDLLHGKSRYEGSLWAQAPQVKIHWFPVTRQQPCLFDYPAWTCRVLGDCWVTEGMRPQQDDQPILSTVLLSSDTSDIACSHCCLSTWAVPPDRDLHPAYTLWEPLHPLGRFTPQAARAWTPSSSYGGRNLSSESQEMNSQQHREAVEELRTEGWFPDPSLWMPSHILKQITLDLRILR